MSEITSRLTAALADRYTIERQLGEGGMATVYLAHNIKHDRKVGIKVLRPELAAVLGGGRFLLDTPARLPGAFRLQPSPLGTRGSIL